MKTRAFTLVEVLVVVAIVASLAGLSIPYAGSTLTRYSATTTRDGLISLITQSRTKAMALDANSAKGVAIGASSITAFSGSSYATRNPSLDTVIPIPGQVSVLPIGEVVFSPLSGATAGGSFTVAGGGASYSVTINGEGSVDW